MSLGHMPLATETDQAVPTPAVLLHPACPPLAPLQGPGIPREPRQAWEEGGEGSPGINRLKPRLWKEKKRARMGSHSSTWKTLSGCRRLPASLPFRVSGLSLTGPIYVHSFIQFINITDARPVLDAWGQT